MTPEKVRIPSLQCPHCDFNNPDGTTSCFGCGEPLTDAVQRLITVRRRRQSVEAISLADLKALRARVRSLSEELRVRRAQQRTGRGPRVVTARVEVGTAPLAGADELAPNAGEV
ncbi:MAG: hypothetical protein CVU56_03150 [Deltaproteobacteria bacterium HGW-Deltaproteobacteria-14]|nr:MAG: hypothetical protein CVU56_03150 [Deltaproteobacteria bacterium HGW-Deltaproteobacteria-14]